MLESDRNAIRERAYFLGARRSSGRASTGSLAVGNLRTLQGQRTDEFVEDEEKVLAGRPDANIPAMLTKDVQGG